MLLSSPRVPVPQVLSAVCDPDPFQVNPKSLGIIFQWIYGQLTELPPALQGGWAPRSSLLFRADVPYYLVEDTLLWNPNPIQCQSLLSSHQCLHFRRPSFVALSSPHAGPSFQAHLCA